MTTDERTVKGHSYKTRTNNVRGSRNRAQILSKANSQAYFSSIADGANRHHQMLVCIRSLLYFSPANVSQIASD